MRKSRFTFLPALLHRPRAAGALAEEQASHSTIGKPLAADGRRSRQESAIPISGLRKHFN